MAVKKQEQASDLIMLVMGVIIGLGLGLVIYYFVSMSIVASEEINSMELTTYCVRENTVNSMSLEDALSIARSSECVEEGTLTNKFMCNSITGTWWIDLNVGGAEGCSPACVISVETGEAELNWRCTGLIT